MISYSWADAATVPWWRRFLGRRAQPLLTTRADGPRGRAGWPDWTCPACAWPSHRDRDAAACGWCPRCLKFTGLCAAGRDVQALEVIGGIVGRDWVIGCPDRGCSLWVYTAPHEIGKRVLLCSWHDAQVRERHSGQVQPFGVPLEISGRLRAAVGGTGSAWRP